MLQGLCRLTRALPDSHLSAILAWICPAAPTYSLASAQPHPLPWLQPGLTPCCPGARSMRWPATARFAARRRPSRRRAQPTTRLTTTAPQSCSWVRAIQHPLAESSGRLAPLICLLRQHFSASAPRACSQLTCSPSSSFPPTTAPSTASTFSANLRPVNVPCTLPALKHCSPLPCLCEGFHLDCTLISGHLCVPLQHMYVYSFANCCLLC